MRLAGFHAELALHAVDDDLQVQPPPMLQMIWSDSSVRRRNDGSSAASAYSDAHLLLVGLWSWARRPAITGSGKTIFDVITESGSLQRLAGGDVLQAHAGGDASAGQIS